MKYQWISNGNSIKRALLHYTENTERIRGFETFSANCVNIEILSLRLIDLRESSKRFRDLFPKFDSFEVLFFFFYRILIVFKRSTRIFQQNEENSNRDFCQIFEQKCIIAARICTNGRY